MLVLSTVDFKINSFEKNMYRNTINVSNGLDSEQDQQNVGPDPSQTVCKGYKHLTKTLIAPKAFNKINSNVDISLQ